MKRPRKKDTVIQDAIAAIEGGHLVFSHHALLRMKERDIDVSDVEGAIYQAKREASKDSIKDDETAWKYAIRGNNDNGDKDLRLILVYLENPKMLLVTAIDLNK